MHKGKEIIDGLLEKALSVLETVIAAISVIVLIGVLAVEIWQIFSNPSFLLAGDDAVMEFLHQMLNIVVGLEFVKLLMHLTPATILEVLIMAISRSIIVSHGSAVDNVLGILCIAGLFAVKRFLISKSELNKELDEPVWEPRHYPRKNKGKHSENQEAPKS